MLAPKEVKTKCPRVITLREICRVLSGTRLDVPKKCKRQLKNKRAHIAACKGIEKMTLSHAACKMEGVMTT